MLCPSLRARYSCRLLDPVEVDANPGGKGRKAKVGACYQDTDHTEMGVLEKPGTRVALSTKVSLMSRVEQDGSFEIKLVALYDDGFWFFAVNRPYRTMR